MSKIDINEPLITRKNIKFIKFPKIRKVNFDLSNPGNIILDKDNDIQSINELSINTIKDINKLKKIGHSLGIYDVTGGRDQLRKKIIEKKKIIEDYHI